MGRAAVRTLVNLVVQEGDEETRATLEQDIENLAADLAGDRPTPAERLLAEVAAIDWHALQHHTFIYNIESQNGMSLAQSEHAQRRIDRTHRRFMLSLKTLATLRRLSEPIVQVNVARQQVNVAGSISRSGDT
jgi:hypothetical protein